MASSTDGALDDAPDVSDVMDRTWLQRARLAGFGLVVLAVLGFAGVVLGELFSLLVLGWTADVGAKLGIHRLHVMVIATVILTTLSGVVVQVYRPSRRAAPMLGAFGSVLLAALIQFAGEGSAGSVIPFAVMIGLTTLLHPAGRQLLHRDRGTSPAMLALLVVAAVPLLAFALAQVRLQLEVADPHAAAGHYTGMAQLGVVPLVYGALAVVGVRGWRVAAWLAALPVAYYGLLSLSFTGQAGSTGVAWGVAAVLWAAGFLAVAEYTRSVGSPILGESVAYGD